MAFSSPPLFLVDKPFCSQELALDQWQGAADIAAAWDNGHRQLPLETNLGAPPSGAVPADRPASMLERARLAKIPMPEPALKCPRCESTNTKFCYFNNYSLTQPRHFCKTCRRYWTHGGVLRNVPVGGGCRRNRRGSKSSASNANPSPSPATAASVSDQLPFTGVFHTFPSFAGAGVPESLDYGHSTAYNVGIEHDRRLPFLTGLDNPAQRVPTGLPLPRFDDEADGGAIDGFVRSLLIPNSGPKMEDNNNSSDSKFWRVDVTGINSWPASNIL